MERSESNETLEEDADSGYGDAVDDESPMLAPAARTGLQRRPKGGEATATAVAAAALAARRAAAATGGAMAVDRLLPHSGSEDDDVGQHSDEQYFYDSASDHLSDRAPHIHGDGFFLDMRKRRPLKRRVEGLVHELRERQKVFRRRQQNLAQTVNRRLRSGWITQQERITRRSKAMASKLQSGRSRAWRHKWVYALVQADLMVTAFWLGASPQTMYLHYTAKVLFAMCFKVFDYIVTKQHYFLLDFCYYANACVLSMIWLFPKSGTLFNASEGACGLLAISVVAFRNSCVPHDFVRVSHAYVHWPALIVLQTIKSHCEGNHCIAVRNAANYRWYVRALQALVMYLMWGTFYYSVIFGFAKRRIEKKQRDTLYNYFAVGLGWRDRLPKSLRPHSRKVFMFGHLILFMVGVWWMFLPVVAQAVGTMVVMLVYFHNGGRFYVDHFWKGYERNALLYIDAAVTAMKEGADGAAAGAEHGGYADADADAAGGSGGKMRAEVQKPVEAGGPDH